MFASSLGPRLPRQTVNWWDIRVHEFFASSLAPPRWTAWGGVPPLLGPMNASLSVRYVTSSQKSLKTHLGPVCLMLEYLFHNRKSDIAPRFIFIITIFKLESNDRFAGPRRRIVRGQSLLRLRGNRIADPRRQCAVHRGLLPYSFQTNRTFVRSTPLSPATVVIVVSESAAYSDDGSDADPPKSSPSSQETHATKRDRKSVV